MENSELENQIRQDLEAALAQVQLNIQADCRVLYVEATEFNELAVDVAIGENCDLQQWDFAINSRIIPVSSVRHYFDCDLELYLSEQIEEINQFWLNIIEELTTIFFERNPEYKIAIHQ